jgi:hypothetical protein
MVHAYTWSTILAPDLHATLLVRILVLALLNLRVTSSLVRRFKKGIQIQIKGVLTPMINNAWHTNTAVMKSANIS